MARRYRRGDGRRVELAHRHLDPTTFPVGLGDGTAGIVLFFLNLHDATGDPNYLSVARAGTEQLLATLPDARASPRPTPWLDNPFLEIAFSRPSATEGANVTQDTIR